MHRGLRVFPENWLSRTLVFVLISVVSPRDGIYAVPSGLSQTAVSTAPCGHAVQMSRAHRDVFRSNKNNGFV
jgi:hypothetical protein